MEEVPEKYVKVTQADIEEIRRLLGEIMSPSVLYEHDLLAMANQVISNMQSCAIDIDNLLIRLVKFSL